MVSKTLASLACDLEAASSKDALLKLLRVRMLCSCGLRFVLSLPLQVSCDRLSAEQQESPAFPAAALADALGKRRLLRHADQVRLRPSPLAVETLKRPRRRSACSWRAR